MEQSFILVNYGMSCIISKSQEGEPNNIDKGANSFFKIVEFTRFTLPIPKKPILQKVESVLF